MLAVAFSSFLIMGLCFIGFIKKNNDSAPTFQRTFKIVTLVVTSGYIIVVPYMFYYRNRDPQPRRQFPYAFTLLKSFLQIILLLIFTYMDTYLKKQERLLVIAVVVSAHLHLVTVFIGFEVAEDFDLVNAFLSVSFTLIFELTSGWLSVTFLVFTAFLLVWTKNLLLLDPREVRRDMKSIIRI